MGFFLGFFTCHKARTNLLQWSAPEALLNIRRMELPIQLTVAVEVLVLMASPSRTKATSSCFHKDLKSKYEYYTQFLNSWNALLDVGKKWPTPGTSFSCRRPRFSIALLWIIYRWSNMSLLEFVIQAYKKYIVQKWETFVFIFTLFARPFPHHFVGIRSTCTWIERACKYNFFFEGQTNNS